MDADHYCLMWNNFQTNFLSALGNLRTSQDLVDVTLMCEGRNIRAHKVILSACSSYFRDLFKEIPCKHPVIILKDVSHYDLTNLLQFMYQGEVLITQECLTSFLKTAELLQISGLAGVMSGARQTPGAESESPKSVIEKLNPEIKITIPSDIENDKRVDYVESTEPTQGCSYQNQVTIPIKTESEEGEYDSNMEMDIRDNNEQFDTLRWNEDSNLLEQTLIVERNEMPLPKKPKRGRPPKRYPINSTADQNPPTENRFALLNNRTFEEDSQKLTSSFSKINEKLGIQKHILVENKGKWCRKRCVVCYENIRKREGRKIAQCRAPRSKYQCNVCEKFYCLTCFLNAHAYGNRLA